MWSSSWACGWICLQVEGSFVLTRFLTICWSNNRFLEKLALSGPAAKDALNTWSLELWQFWSHNMNVKISIFKNYELLLASTCLRALYKVELPTLMLIEQPSKHLYVIRDGTRPFQSITSIHCLLWADRIDSIELIHVIYVRLSSLYVMGFECFCGTYTTYLGFSIFVFDDPDGSLEDSVCWVSLG